VTGTAGAILVVSTGPASARAAYPSDPFIHLDEPKLGEHTAGTVEVRGFAVDRNDADEPSIEKVTVFLDGLDAGQQLGDATYGTQRPDVAELFDNENYLRSGWTYQWSAGALEGNHTLYVVARSKSGRVSVLSREVNDPLVSIDSPAAGAKLRQGTPVEIAGWALDRSDTEADGIESVTLYVDSKTSTPLGTATLGQASPDLADRYGDRFGTSGWTFSWELDETTSLGEHTLYAVAQSSVSGHETTATLRFEVVSAEEESANGAGCSEWAHLRNATWHEAHGMWQSARAEVRSLAPAGAKKGGRGPVQLALGAGRTSIDSVVKSVHREIQNYALSHKCEAGPAAEAAYAEILSEYRTDLEQELTEAKLAVELAMVEAAKADDDEKGNGRGKPKGVGRSN
jgi:hypothetical protein